MTTEQNNGDSADFVNELTQLGKNLGRALRTALDSPQRKEIEGEVRTGFQSVVVEINDALAKARGSDVTKDVEGQAGKVAQDLGQQAEKMIDAVRNSQVTADLREGFAVGLHSLNEELDGLIQKMQDQSGQVPTAEVDSTASVVDEPIITPAPDAADMETPDAPASETPDTADQAPNNELPLFWLL